MEGDEAMREWLRNLRTQKGWTQRETAEMLHIATNYYNMIECGKRQSKMTIDMAQKLASVFDVSLEYIFANEA